MNRRRFLAAFSSGAFFAGCGQRVAGREAALPRIVSTSPSMTEIVFAIGRGSSLVGRSSFCDYPAETLAIEVVGGFADPNLERIVALQPTLVTGERGPAGPDLPGRLGALGIGTYFPLIDRVTDIEKTIEEMGQKLAAADAARTLARELGAQISAVGERVRGAKRPRVVFLFDFRPLIAAGPESFPADALSLAGCDNAVTSGSKYPTLGPEGLLALDPDLIIDGSAGAYPESAAELVRSITGLSHLRALREQRVVRLEGTAALRPGPRIGAGIEQIAKIAHGNVLFP